MTPIILLDDLQKFIAENTEDILLECRVRTGTPTEKERAAKVYKMGLPQKDDTQQQIPYILLKVVTGADEKEANQPKSSEVKVRIIIVTYSPDGEQGPLALLNLIMRIRERLEKQHIIGGRFCLQYPLEYIIYQDTEPPYYLGEIMTNWTIPTIEREVQKAWQ
jgi:hypothetical protein